MKYHHGDRRKPQEYEKALIDYWKKHNTFQKSIDQNPQDKSYVFYDGPPFITGNPHHGTLLSSVVKDAVPRFWTMNGYRVERRWGWDCHGLPAENFTEKHLGGTVARTEDPKMLELKIGEETSQISLEKYIETARDLMVANSATWESTIDRIGRWVDFKGAYKTMDKDFMESVWWAFKELYEKGKIYEGEKVLMYDTTFATPVSKNEVTMDNDAYQTVTDPSVFVKFKLQDEKSKELIAQKKWYGISGSWRSQSNALKKDLLEAINKIIMAGGGVVSGGALGVDYLATELMMTVEDWQNRLKIIIPTTLQIYKEHYFKRADEGVITHEQAENLISLLTKVKDGGCLVEMDFNVLNDKTYFARNTEIVKACDELLAFQMNDSAGVQDTVDKAEKIGKKTSINKYYANKHLLAWTTTPWTLPANTAVAVNAKLTYIEVRIENDIYILAKTLADKILIDDKKQPLNYEILQEFTGDKLIGKKYHPIFADHGKNAHQVYAADYVDDSDGTGIVHLAPIYGEVDFELAEKEDVPKVHTIDDHGYYYPEIAAQLHKIGVRDTDEKGIEVWAANKFIAKCLANHDHNGQELTEEETKQGRGIVWKIEYIKHEYPFNPRSKQRIMYRAIPSWFFDVQNSKSLMLEQNQNINWFPEYLKNGRFAKNIEQAPDWNLSRDRFWATPMPVWKGDQGTIKVIGSYQELEQLSGKKLQDYHRPWIDDIEFDLPYKKGVQKHHIKLGKNAKVLFVCWSNVGRSQIAKAIYNKLLGNDNAESAGVGVEKEQPEGTTIAERNKIVGKELGIENYKSTAQIALLEKHDIDITHWPRTQLTPKMLKEYDLVVNIAEKFQTPDWFRGENVIWWDIKDPGILKTMKAREVATKSAMVEIEKRAKDLLSGKVIDDDIDTTNSGKTEHFTRIEKVLDCWFESGSMPFAQLHYPFENKEKFEKNYPADFIVEYIGQVRAWFYYVHAVNTALFGTEAFRNVITTGTLAGNDGRKMSKSLGNYTDPNELMDKYSADALRFLMLSSPVLSGEDFALLDKDVSDVARKLAMIWNMYDFFTMYAAVDGWDSESAKEFDLKNLKNPLDIWIISRLHQLKATITENMKNYNIPDALSPVLPFIDDASNWYVRRSRRRFWKSEDDADKNQAYYTLCLVLRKLAVLLAPFTPFLAEELHQKMTGEESVHLLPWPTNTTVDQKVLDDMSRTRQIINALLSDRMNQNDKFGPRKIRQPLEYAAYSGTRLPDFYRQIIEEETNVKMVYNWGIKVEYQHRSKLCKMLEVKDGEAKTDANLFLKGFNSQNGFFFADKVALKERNGIDVEELLNSNKIPFSEVDNAEPVFIHKELTEELEQEGFARELIRFIQSARKKAGLQIDDRINLSISEPIPTALQPLIQQETLALTLTQNQNYTYDELIKIDNKQLTISLEKAS